MVLCSPGREAASQSKEKFVSEFGPRAQFATRHATEQVASIIRLFSVPCETDGIAPSALRILEIRAARDSIIFIRCKAQRFRKPGPAIIR